MPNATGRIDGARTQWLEAAQHFNEMATRLDNAHPPVIDHFLGHNPSLQDVGKLLIAWVILEREAIPERGYNLNRGNQAKLFEDVWHRYLVAKLTNNCRTAEDLLTNNVTFVTFNYDVSLEQHITESLLSYDKFRSLADEFFKKARPVHLYGSIRDASSMSHIVKPSVIRDIASRPNDMGDIPTHYHELKTIFDLAWAASKTIYAIGPDDKEKCSMRFDSARAYLDEVECVYILGYGFDEENNERLALDYTIGHRTDKPKVVQFTNKDNISNVNQVASMTFLNNLEGFDPELGRSAARIGNHYYRKSTGNVYEALSKDFGNLEEYQMSAMLP